MVETPEETVNDNNAKYHGKKQAGQSLRRGGVKCFRYGNIYREKK